MAGETGSRALQAPAPLSGNQKSPQVSWGPPCTPSRLLHLLGECARRGQGSFSDPTLVVGLVGPHSPLSSPIRFQRLCTPPLPGPSLPAEGAQFLMSFLERSSTGPVHSPAAAPGLRRLVAPLLRLPCALPHLLRGHPTSCLYFLPWLFHANVIRRKSHSSTGLPYPKCHVTSRLPGTCSVRGQHPGPSPHQQPVNTPLRAACGSHGHREVPEHPTRPPASPRQSRRASPPAPQAWGDPSFFLPLRVPLLPACLGAFSPSPLCGPRSVSRAQDPAGTSWAKPWPSAGASDSREPPQDAGTFTSTSGSAPRPPPRPTPPAAAPGAPPLPTWSGEGT